MINVGNGIAMCSWTQTGERHKWTHGSVRTRKEGKEKNSRIATEKQSSRHLSVVCQKGNTNDRQYERQPSSTQTPFTNACTGRIVFCLLFGAFSHHDIVHFGIASSASFAFSPYIVSVSLFPCFFLENILRFFRFYSCPAPLFAGQIF